MTLGFLSGSKNFCKLLCVSWEVFVLHGCHWIHWVAESCTTIAYRWLFRDSNFHWELCVCCYQVTNIFCTRYGSAIASSARGPCDFGPLADLAISVFREMSINTVLTQIRTFRRRKLRMVRSKNWRVSLCVQELHHPPHFLWILAATPGFQNLRDVRRQTTSVRVLSWSPFYLFLVFLVGWATLLVIGFTANNGFHRSIINIETWHRLGEEVSLSVRSSFSSLIITWYCCRWWRRRAWRRCRTMPLPSSRCHWSWKMRTGGRTRWQAWNHDRNEFLRIANNPNSVINEMWFLTVDSLIRISDFHRKAFQATILLACYRVLSLSRIFHSLTYTVASSCVCTSPLAVMTIVRLHDFVKVSISASFKSLFADHMHRRSGVHNKFSFLKFKSWCRQTQIFRRWEECSLSCSFNLAPIFRKWEECCSVFLL